ncbi:MAG TPA: glycosyltransferase family A protein [Acetobacteraceae bacterium]|nr:glycosyltransferase family A protein [Acetobacteraceae bacterium]
MQITVVTPAFNAADTIADTIGSVLAQSHGDLRLVVVDDGSSDDTAAVAAGLGDPRLALVRQANAGVSAARNRGAEAVESDAILFLDADDWLAPNALATLSATLEAAPEAVAVVGRYATVAASGESPRPARYRPVPALRDMLPGLLVRNQFANGGHVLIRRAAARRAGPFRTDIAYGEDWEFFARLALLGPFAFVLAREPLLFVRSRAEGAYRRLAADPAAFSPCMTAIFGNPDLLGRFGPGRLRAIRRCTEAENAWIIGRECIRHGHVAKGRRWLARSLTAAPSPRRVALLAAACLLPALPPSWRGPFRAYGGQPSRSSG